MRKYTPLLMIISFIAGLVLMINLLSNIQGGVVLLQNNDGVMFQY